MPLSDFYKEDLRRRLIELGNVHENSKTAPFFIGDLVDFVLYEVTAVREAAYSDGKIDMRSDVQEAIKQLDLE